VVNHGCALANSSRLTVISDVGSHHLNFWTDFCVAATAHDTHMLAPAE